MPRNRCQFNQKWLIDSRFKTWIAEAETSSMAKCLLCRTSFDISNMGIGALVSHQSGKKHKEVFKNRTSFSTTFFDKSSRSSGTTDNILSGADQSCGSKTVQKNATVDSMIISVGSCHAEILWAIKIVMSKFSFNSCKKMGELFCVMFPDNEIAKIFKLGPSKCAYLITYGIAPYFKNLLQQAVKAAPYFVASFDECSNRITQDEQKDVVLRYWDTTEPTVKTRYYSSDHTRAEDFLEKS